STAASRLVTEHTTYRPLSYRNHEETWTDRPDRDRADLAVAFSRGMDTEAPTVHPGNGAYADRDGAPVDKPIADVNAEQRQQPMTQGKNTACAPHCSSKNKHEEPSNSPGDDDSVSRNVEIGLGAGVAPSDSASNSDSRDEHNGAKTYDNDNSSEEEQREWSAVPRNQIEARLARWESFQVPDWSEESATMDIEWDINLLELLNIHNAFQQGQYAETVAFDTSALSPENALPARILKLRAQIALGQIDEVLADVEGEEDQASDLAAVRALAYQAGGNGAMALKEAERLAAEEGDNATVQILAGTVLQAHGKSEEALQLLAKHQGNLEAVALITQIHLASNRTDLALKEVQAAKRWAQDSLLVNLAESWVGLRVGGEKYQSAFYVFEELASVPNTSSVTSIVGQAVSELHLGRLPEAETALRSALEKFPDNAEVIANTIVISALTGKKTDDLVQTLRTAHPQHQLVIDIAEKSALFDTAASKYSPKVSS
ncbi:hypothetical protein KEM54_001763, partial [Ascosphaera aggregata]